MMNLRSKLSCLRAESGQDADSLAKASAASELQRRLARIGSRRLTKSRPGRDSEAADKAMAQRLTGYQIAEGVIQIQRRLPLDGTPAQDSSAQLRSSLQLPGEGREAHLRQLYVDTETTGLSGGSGTLAFLIGMATVDEDALVVTQYLLTRFAGEPSMLAAFNRALTADDRLVSYNGKSFDLPLLLTRYRMQNEPQSLSGLPHLDLLHSVRRLYAKRWPDCRLTTLEQRLLGFRRRHDLPGSEAPAAWADYQRQGEDEKLIRVVEHNRQDILSLALAHGALVQAIARPEQHGVDIAALAQWLSKSDKAGAYALLKSARQPLCNRGKRLLGQMARRAEEWELALGIWEELAAGGCEDSMQQLAKYHEHVSGNLAKARSYCERMGPGVERTRRLARLETKLHRQGIQSTLGGMLTDNPLAG